MSNKHSKLYRSVLNARNYLLGSLEDVNNYLVEGKIQSQVKFFSHRGVKPQSLSFESQFTTSIGRARVYNAHKAWIERVIKNHTPSGTNKIVVNSPAVENAQKTSIIHVPTTVNVEYKA